MLKLEDINKDAQIREIQSEDIVRIVQGEPVGGAVDKRGEQFGF